MTPVSVLVALVVAVIFYLVATAVVAFSHSTLIFGLIAAVIFVALALEGVGFGGWRRRGGPPVA